MPSLKIYLAGPEVFLPEFGRPVFEAKKAACAELGYAGISPMDGEVPLDGLAPFAQGVAIYRANLAHMARADAIIANMTPFRGVSMDAGTAFEMGYMAAAGKPVLGYSHVARPFGERSASYYAHGRPDLLETYSAGTSVERFDMADNLMMVAAAHCAGFGIQVLEVQSGAELTSIAGFRRCLEALTVHQKRARA